HKGRVHLQGPFQLRVQRDVVADDLDRDAAPPGQPRLGGGGAAAGAGRRHVVGAATGVKLPVVGPDYQQAVEAPDRVGEPLPAKRGVAEVDEVKVVEILLPPDVADAGLDLGPAARLERPGHRAGRLRERAYQLVVQRHLLGGDLQGGVGVFALPAPGAPGGHPVPARANAQGRAQEVIFQVEVELAGDPLQLVAEAFEAGAHLFRAEDAAFPEQLPAAAGEVEGDAHRPVRPEAALDLLHVFRQLLEEGGVD